MKGVRKKKLAREREEAINYRSNVSRQNQQLRTTLSNGEEHI